MSDIFTYDVLNVIWWLLLGVVFTGYAIMGGFDLGVSMLFTKIASNKEEKSIIINSVGSIWESNQAWLVLFVGAIFASRPIIYGAVFSDLYPLLIILLFSLIFRPVSFKFRLKSNSATWQKFWELSNVVSAISVAFIAGVIIGNIILGSSFSFDFTMRMINDAGAHSLFNPFALFMGLMAVIMVASQGASYIALKTNGNIQERASRFALIFLSALLAIYVVGALGVSAIEGYRLVGTIDPNVVQTPFSSVEVLRKTGLYTARFIEHKWTLIVPIIVVASIISSAMFNIAQKYLISFICSSLAVAGMIATIGTIMFPFILPSFTHPEASLTIWNSASSYTTLTLMTIVTIILFPIILFYIGWVLSVLRGPFDKERLAKSETDTY